MKISKLSDQFKFLAQYIPVKLNFILLMSSIPLIYWFLSKSNHENSSYFGLIKIMSSIVLVLVIVLVFIASMTVLITWMYFLTHKDRPGESDLILSIEKNNKDQDHVYLKIVIPYGLKPLLGWLKVRLIYDKNRYTEALPISEQLNKSFLPFRRGIMGINRIILPDIKEYQIQSAFLFFEDFLQLFSIPVHCKVNQQFMNAPENLLRQQQELPPKKTEEELVRIEQLRKVEGEHLNYKKFEDSDDVRRIVWKIFAKNRELMVRIPEIMDPFASHVYFYASFYNDSSFDAFNPHGRAMLNHYKKVVWTLFDALRKSSFEVRYIPDQSVHYKEQNEIDPVQRSITLQQWHQDQTVSNFFKPQRGTVLCVHSMSSVSDLEKILSQCDAQTTLFFVRLGRTFKSAYLLHWISRIFIQAPADGLARLKSKWVFQPMKYKLEKNEKHLLSIIQQSAVNLEII